MITTIIINHLIFLVRKDEGLGREVAWSDSQTPVPMPHWKAGRWSRWRTQQTLQATKTLVQWWWIVTIVVNTGEHAELMMLGSMQGRRVWIQALHHWFWDSQGPLFWRFLQAQPDDKPQTCRCCFISTKDISVLLSSSGIHHHPSLVLTPWDNHHWPSLTKGNYLIWIFHMDAIYSAPTSRWLYYVIL